MAVTGGYCTSGHHAWHCILVPLSVSGVQLQSVTKQPAHSHQQGHPCYRVCRLSSLQLLGKLLVDLAAMREESLTTQVGRGGREATEQAPIDWQWALLKAS
jgi:hypothetical protein